MEDNFDKFIEFAPIIVVVLVFIWRNNIFVSPESLEKKHREIIEEVSQKFVELNAYKVFQDSINDSLERVTRGIDELKNFLMKGHSNDK